DELRSDEELEEEVAVVFDQIWDSPAPSKCGIIHPPLYALSECYDGVRIRENYEDPSRLLVDMACNSLVSMEGEE
ncbi:hypothetical protein L195_g056446, partial [Trifolium pratense]